MMRLSYALPRIATEWIVTRPAFLRWRMSFSENRHPLFRDMR